MIIKSCIGIAVGCLCVFGAPAHAESSETTESFLAAVTAANPKMGLQMRALGQDYEAKCGRPLTVFGYRFLAANSGAFSVRMAMQDVNRSTIDQWSPEVQYNYRKLVENISCDF